MREKGKEYGRTAGCARTLFAQEESVLCANRGRISNFVKEIRKEDAGIGKAAARGVSARQILIPSHWEG